MIETKTKTIVIDSKTTRPYKHGDNSMRYFTTLTTTDGEKLKTWNPLLRDMPNGSEVKVELTRKGWCKIPRPVKGSNTKGVNFTDVAIRVAQEMAEVEFKGNFSALIHDCVMERARSRGYLDR